jgi:hypothetical protein
LAFVTNPPKGFEKGDMLIVMKVPFLPWSMLVSVIAHFEPPLLRKFYHIDSIKDFYKRSHESWASTNVQLLWWVLEGETMV